MKITNMLNKVKYKFKSNSLTLLKNIHESNTGNKRNSCNKNISKYEILLIIMITVVIIILMRILMIEIVTIMIKEVFVTMSIIIIIIIITIIIIIKWWLIEEKAWKGEKIVTGTRNCSC